MRRWRRVLGGAGVLLLGYGGLQLVTGNSVADLLSLAVWLVAAVAIHDGLVSPTVLGAGALLHRLPPGPRRFAQAGLVVGAMLVVIAVPLIHREGTQPESKALLLRDYGANLAVLLSLVAVVSVVAYVVHVVRARGDSRRAVSDPSRG
ncbi:MAG: hypothetical protein ABI807_10240 [Sporichthyaceae bacterium]